MEGHLDGAVDVMQCDGREDKPTDRHPTQLDPRQEWPDRCPFPRRAAYERPGPGEPPDGFIMCSRDRPSHHSRQILEVTVQRPRAGVEPVNLGKEILERLSKLDIVDSKGHDGDAPTGGALELSH